MKIILILIVLITTLSSCAGGTSLTTKHSSQIRGKTFVLVKTKPAGFKLNVPYRHITHPFKTPRNGYFFKNYYNIKSPTTSISNNLLSMLKSKYNLRLNKNNSPLYKGWHISSVAAKYKNTDLILFFSELLIGIYTTLPTKNIVHYGISMDLIDQKSNKKLAS